MSSLFDVGNECIFSEDRRHRYTLRHVWDERLPPAMVIGLNPSTADEQKLDPTLRRVRGLLKADGFGSFVMTNLFAFRATDPKSMMCTDDRIGPANDSILRSVASEVLLAQGRIIAAWGIHGSWKDRDKEVVRLLSPAELWVWELTDAGQPRHPLYLPGGTKLVKWIVDSPAAVPSKLGHAS